MALDGAFLHHLKHEIEETALGARVDKLYQPNRNEIVLILRSREGIWKLLLSTRANSARIHFISSIPENPKVPPMLCMLLRKRLVGAKLVGIRQPGLERVLLLDFDAIDELGDPVRLTLAAEIMGRYSNLILIDKNGKVIDALKRVNAEMSSERLILPGITYQLPPQQAKLCLLDFSPEEIIQKVESLPADMELSKALLKSIQGLSPIVCRELQFQIGGGQELFNHTLSGEMKERTIFFLGQLKETVLHCSGIPYMISNNEKPFDFSFLPIHQYGTQAVLDQKENFSVLLDDFYGERDRVERMRIKSRGLLHILSTSSDRLSRKINTQQGELEQCAKRDELRLCGDLLSANLYRIEKGASSVELENFYEEAMPIKTISLDPALTANQNAQKYYKEYRKAHTAEQILTVQIHEAEKELRYLDTVFDELLRAELERDLNEIRVELMEQGYIRIPKGTKQKQPKESSPWKFMTSDGHSVLVGRNNHQNDLLTLKKAHKNDLWFHTQKVPGSHVILETSGEAPSETAILECASLAAFYSHAKDSAQVPVDYTLVRYVSKPQGARPGMVIYREQKTIYCTPDPEIVKQLKKS
ncbi:Fibronectin/fibrinogen-binding protein [Ruminococcaceae bacterium BL-4]|nr:Fibronectin/fibrinogen-binding protein [Ruminococcaceae bacterium BL-4]